MPTCGRSRRGSGHGHQICVLAITFAAPAVAIDWAISKAGLGFGFSAELLGMAAGSFFVAPLADLLGRRPLVLHQSGDDVLRVRMSSGSGGMIGICSVVSRTFPARMRASGTGLVIGVGGLGAVLSRIVTDALFKAEFLAVPVSAVMALPALLAVCCSPHPALAR